MPNYSGLWSSRQQMQAKGQSLWPAVPGAPTIGTAVGGNASASVAFTAPADPGNPATITAYTATSSPGGFTGTGSASPVTVSGLTNGTAYTFTVTATNASGTGSSSAASNSVTPAAYGGLPVYNNQGPSSYITSPTGTVNGTAYKLMGPSSNQGLVNSTTLDSHTYYCADALAYNWYIGANFGYGTPTRWSSVNRIGFPGSGASQSPAYITADGVSVFTTGLNGTVRSGTSAGTILFTNDYNANSNLLKPGSFQFDAITFSNGSGNGFANWYADGNKGAQTYPSITTNAFNNWNGASNVQIYDSMGQGDDGGGWVWWRPPLLTNEVMIDFGNAYDENPCRFFVWNNNTGSLVMVLTFGKFGAVNITAGAINDPYTRTIIIKHTEGFVYFMGDAGPTIAGSHYYLYR